MKTVKNYIYSALMILSIFLAACSTTTDPAESYRGETPEHIFQKGEDALRDKNYAEAIKRFEALDAQYPFDRNSETAQLHIIYAYYMNSDYVAAESAADRFIHAHPTNPHVDYAYYMRGLANYYQNMGVFERLFAVDFATRDLTQVKKSFNDFDQLQTRYPGSAFAPAAHQYTIYLRDVLSDHQLEVAQYYFKREAYVASANRASVVVENYQGTPAVPDALVMMAKSYYQLHLPDQMNQTIQVLNYNYPNSKYMQEVSGSQLSSKHFSIVKRREAPAPKRKAAMTPPTENQAYPFYASNGNRGGLTTVSDLVKSIRASQLFQSRPQQNPAQVSPQPQPQQMASRENPQTQPQQPTQSTAKNSAPVKLNALLENLSNMAFGTHKSQQQTTNDQQIAENTPPAAPAVVNQQNGMRR